MRNCLINPGQVPDCCDVSLRCLHAGKFLDKQKQLLEQVVKRLALTKETLLAIVHLQCQAVGVFAGFGKD